jgi:hypothetical protein
VLAHAPRQPAPWLIFNVSQKMKTRFALLGITLALVAPRVFAEWRALKDASGHVVEVVVDFSVENLRIGADGTSAFKARAEVDGAEVSFLVSISKARKGQIAVLSRETEVPIMRVDVDIRSSGASTKNLERRLADQLGMSARNASSLRIAGPRNGICPLGAASIAQVASIYASDVGLTYTESGEQIAGECFDLQLIVDAPTNRITVYFSEPEGYGGISKKDRARNDWFKLHQKG